MRVIRTTGVKQIVRNISHHMAKAIRILSRLGWACHVASKAIKTEHTSNRASDESNCMVGLELVRERLNDWQVFNLVAHPCSLETAEPGQPCFQQHSTGQRVSGRPGLET